MISEQHLDRILRRMLWIFLGFWFTFFLLVILTKDINFFAYCCAVLYCYWYEFFPQSAALSFYLAYLITVKHFKK